MVDPMLVVVLVLVGVAIAGGVKITIGNINIGNRTRDKDDN